MKKLFVIMLMVLAQFMVETATHSQCCIECEKNVHKLKKGCAPVFGNFFLDSEQCVPGNCYEAINWLES